MFVWYNAGLTLSFCGLLNQKLRIKQSFTEKLSIQSVSVFTVLLTISKCKAGVYVRIELSLYVKFSELKEKK